MEIITDKNKVKIFKWSYCDEKISVAGDFVRLEDYNDLLKQIRVLTRDEIMGVLARGYCTKRNRYKVSDPDLIADQVDALLKAGSTEVGVEEIYEELKNWGGNIQSSQSLTSEEMDEFLKDIAQSINNLKEKE